MNRLLSSQKYFLILTSFLLSYLLFIAPVASHSGHPHNSVKPESSPQPKTSNSEDIPSSKPVNKPTPLKVKETLSTNDVTENHVSLIPKPSELLFLLLLVNPLILYKLRLKLHS